MFLYFKKLYSIIVIFIKKYFTLLSLVIYNTAFCGYTFLRVYSFFLFTPYLLLLYM